MKSRREQVIRLLLRRHTLDLKQAREELANAERIWNEATTRTRQAQYDASRSMDRQRAGLVQGEIVDVAIQRCAGLELGEHWRKLAECEKFEARRLHDVELVRKDVAARQAQIRRIEDAAEREAQAQRFKADIRMSNEQDALWLGSKSVSESS